MDIAAITDYITHTFADVDVVVASRESGAPEVAWGDRFFTYDPDGTHASRGWLPFATIVTKDYGDFDCASHLNRPGVFRLNIGVGKETYDALCGTPPPPEEADGAATPPIDFTALDRILPHPIYGRQHWVCVLNPSVGTFRSAVRPLLAEAYARAVARYAHGADQS